MNWVPVRFRICRNIPANLRRSIRFAQTVIPAFAFSLFGTPLIVQAFASSGLGSQDGVPNLSISPTELSLERQEVLQNFETAFSTISESKQVTVVAEGIPLRQHLTDSEASKLVLELAADKAAALDSVMSKVALAYDYDAERVDASMFVLRKRYTDPADLPCVTYAEIIRSLQRILDVTDAYAPAPPVLGNDTSSFDFYASLTPEQQLLARETLTLADLSPQQRTLALAAARQVALDSHTQFIRATLNFLESLRNKRTICRWIKYDNSAVFGIEGPFAHDGRIGQLPLANGYMCQAGGGAMRPSEALLGQICPKPDQSAIVFKESAPGPIVAKPFVDPSTPTEQDRLLAAGMLSNNLPSTITLSELPDSDLFLKNAKVRITVDNAVGSKPVCVFGTKYNGLERVINASARIYGLNIARSEDGLVILSTTPRHTLTGPEDVSKELPRIIPVPLLHYLDGQARRIGDTLPRSAIPSDWTPERRARMQAAEDHAARDESLPAAGDSMYFPAQRRLLVLAEPAARTPGSTPVQLSNLDPEVYRLLALMMLSDMAMPQIKRLESFVFPQSLADPSRMHIQMKGSNLPSGQMLDARFGYVDSTDKFRREGGSVFMQPTGF